MARRQTPGRREQVRRHEVSDPEDEKVAEHSPTTAGPVGRSEVVGLGAEEIADIPLPRPEPAGTVRPGGEEATTLPLPIPDPVGMVGMDPDPVVMPAPEAPEAGGLGGEEVSGLPVPIPGPAGQVGMDPDPFSLTAGRFGEVADPPMPLPEPLEGEGIALGDEEGPVPSLEPTQLLAIDEEEGPVQP
jgi:hypothetical protein